VGQSVVLREQVAILPWEAPPGLKDISPALTGRGGVTKDLIKILNMR